MLRTHRPTIPLVATLLAAALVSPGCGERTRAAPSDEVVRTPPSVIVLVLDTLRADRCGFLGSERGLTPRLDAFARECIVFEDAWSPAGWTGPAHASLFTGLRPTHHGFLMDGNELLAPEHVTLAEHLRSAGYRAAGVSCNPVVSEAFGLAQGFDPAYRLAFEMDQPIPPAADAYPIAMDFVRASRRAGRPFLLFVNSADPHLPYEPPPDLEERFVDPRTSRDVLYAARRWDTWAALNEMVGVSHPSAARRRVLPSLYDGEVASLDRQTGDLLDMLRSEGVLDDALVVVTADHGEQLGDHGLWAHRVGLYGQICRVPLLVHLPGGARRGDVVRDVVRLEDVLPTVLEVCGLPVPAGLDGASLLGDVHGRVARATRGSQTRVLEGLRVTHPRCDGALLERSERSVYDGREHLVEASDGTARLYDRATDPDEEDDLSAAHPDDVERLRKLLDD